MKKYTAIVLGAGPAGYTCAVRMAQLGGKVAIIERDYIGGICINWGCTPSKAMIESGKIAKVVKESSKYGINVSKYKIEFNTVASRRDRVVKETREEVTHLLKHYNIDIYYGEGEVVNNNTVKVHFGKLNIDEKMELSDKTEDITADHLIIATGSKPIIPGFMDESDPWVVTSKRLITIESLPKDLTIIGGGVIGLEFATIFSNLGSKVTVIEYQDRVLSQLDLDVSLEITKYFNNSGVNILTNHKVISIKNGVVKAENQETKNIMEVKSKKTLVAIGRIAVINNKAYNLLGLDYTECGININNYLKTNIPGVWAIGDSTGKSILAHVGIQQGIICAENIMKSTKEPDTKDSELREMDYSIIPAVVYSVPEVAAVGEVPEDLKGIKVAKIPFSANLRANIEEYNEGFVKIWVRDNVILAAQAVGYNVSETIQELANMIALKTDINDVATIIHAHPTYIEINRAVLEHALGKAIEYYEE